MMHSFDIDLAGEVGIEAAIIFANIQHWVIRNRANGENVRDGKAWMYNSRSAWCEIFPYIGEKQVRNALGRLVEAELIERGNYSYGAVNRTYWYTLTEKAAAFGPKGQTVRPKGPNIGSDQKGQTKTVGKPLENSTLPPTPSGGAWEDDESFMRVVEAYPNRTKVDSGAAYLVWSRKGLKKDVGEILKAIPVYAAQPKWRSDEGRYMPKLSAFLDGEDWRQVARGLMSPEELAAESKRHKAQLEAYFEAERQKKWGKPKTADQTITSQSATTTSPSSTSSSGPAPTERSVVS